MRVARVRAQTRAGSNSPTGFDVVIIDWVRRRWVVLTLNVADGADEAIVSPKMPGATGCRPFLRRSPFSRSPTRNLRLALPTLRLLGTTHP